MGTTHLLAVLLAYIVAGRLVMRRLTGSAREAVMAGLSLLGVFYILFNPELHPALLLGTYVALVVGFYLALRLFVDKDGGWPWLAFFAPIAALILFRYVPVSVFAAVARALGKTYAHRALNLIGISYLAFRCSRLVLEVRNGFVKRPNFLEYLNFAFFLPTMPVGPINTYANFRRGFEAKPYAVPMGRAALRILVGAVKYEFLGYLCERLAYSGLLLDDHPHPWMDLPVAVLFYYLYLYLNFSGFCDMAIGASALIGIPVFENFNNPFAARNMKEFWNRWHITLSVWMRDVVFSPLSKFLVRLMGVPLADHAIALTIAVVFLLVGIWHGVGWNFVAYGAVHAFGVVTNHYYTIGLKKWLGRDGFKAYNSNVWIRSIAVVLTFCFCAASLFFFANSVPEMRQIFSALR